VIRCQAKSSTDVQAPRQIVDFLEHGHALAAVLPPEPLRAAAVTTALLVRDLCHPAVK